MNIVRKRSTRFSWQTAVFSTGVLSARTGAGTDTSLRACIVDVVVVVVVAT